MPSSSHHSSERPSAPPERAARAGESEGLRRRFVEALRRAEIIGLINAAEDEAGLGRTLADELGEAYDAEIVAIAELPSEDRPVRLVGSVGLPADGDPAELGRALAGLIGGGRATALAGADLLGLGAEHCLVAGFEAEGGRRLAIAVLRQADISFDPPERALLEAVALGAGHGFERLWARAERDELIAHLKISLVGTAEALANALEAKDDYTANHASEVADLAVAVGAELGMSESQLEDLRYGAIFHDIGKIAIPDAILNKPGPLDEDERKVMMRHPEIGAEILAPIPFVSEPVLEIVSHDHERWDGDGYPAGLAGIEIPLGARIVLVVDSFHAMTSDRPYRKAMSEEDAVRELRDHSGTQFDPEVVAAFLATLRR